MSASQIPDLPKEILGIIFILTDGRTLGICRRVCTKWKEYIDETDSLWKKMCMKDFECSSKIAKRKSGNDCRWYYIYRNLRRWCDSESYYIENMKEFYKFNGSALNVDYGLLPVTDSNVIVLFDTSTLKRIPITLPEKNCLKIANNDDVTVVLLPDCKLLVQRTICSTKDITETVFSAENFALANDYIYYYKNRDIFKCNIQNPNLSLELIVNCDYDISDIAHEDGVTCVFTKCRQFLNVLKDNTVVVHPIYCPSEWLPQLKNMFYFNNKNFICYSRHLFILETVKCTHLYTQFPHITASFFYVDMVIIGTNTGEILLFKLFNDKPSIDFFRGDVTKCILLLKLPNDNIPLKIDVCERKTGSLILVTTCLEIYMIDISFHPAEEEVINTSMTPSKSKIDMYDRLLKIKERLERSRND